MTEKKSGGSNAATGQAKARESRKPESKGSDKPSKPAAVDRAGFDLGGSSGNTSAGTGLGLGKDASESRSGRSLPGRRGKSK